jgi:hypothetical protein
MNLFDPSKHRQTSIQGIIAILLAGSCFSGFSQNLASPPAYSHGVALTALRSDSLIPLDSTLSVTVVAENKGKNVVEAVVILVDSASGDTLENWYPLFPPESADSIVMFWNTKGTKTGSHTLTAVLVAPADNNSPALRVSRNLTIVP